MDALYWRISADVIVYIFPHHRGQGIMPARYELTLKLSKWWYFWLFGCSIHGEMSFQKSRKIFGWQKRWWAHTFFVKFWVFKPANSFYFVYFEIIQTQNKSPNNIQKTSPQSYKIKIKILIYPGVAKLGFEQPGPGALLLGLPKSIYYQW